MAGRPPPPSSKAPISRETVEVVRRKITAPSGPPPAGMTANFSAPKSINTDRSQYKRGNYRADDDDEDDDDNDEEIEYRDRRRTSSSRPRTDSRERDDSRHSENRRRGEADYRYDPRHRRSSADYDNGDDRRYFEDEEEVDDRDAADEFDNEEEEHHRRENHHREGGERRIKPTYDDQPSPMKGEPVAAVPYAQGKESSHIPLVTAQPVGGAKEAHGATYGPSNSMSKSSGGKPSLYNFQRLLSSTYRELRQFVLNPAPPNCIVRCYIERNRSFSKMLAPVYSLCADLEDGTGRELMVCKKIMKSRTSHYVFSLKSDDLYVKREQRSKLFLGKLRATSNHDYVLYDNGICAAPDDPDSLLEALESSDHESESLQSSTRETAVAKKMERDRQDAAKAGTSAGFGDDVSLYRKEMVVIHFNSKSRPAPVGTRGMEVCVPLDPAQSGSSVAESKTSVSSSSSANPHVFNIVKPFERIRLAQKQNAMFRKSCLVLHEKISRYDPLSSCLVDFRGRAHMASVKNFQLVISDPMCNYPSNPSGAQEMLLQRDADAEFFLQLGKTTDECFNMDYRAPLSLLQSFAICIARFDANLKW